MLKVLVAPLDWGLGHATRCIPIIKGLVDQRCTVIIAARGAQKAVLQEEFPDLSFVEMPGFRLKYGKNRAFTLLKIIFAVPKILIGIKRENRWLRRFAAQEGLGLVISDNRYGLYGDGFISVFMTHQLTIKSSFGRATDWLLQRVNYAFIRRFPVCWVPDVAGPHNLAGELSHPRQMPDVPVRYIGWLSRLEAPCPEVSPDQEGPGRRAPAGEVIDLLVILSGPEPQRTILEMMLMSQLNGLAGKFVVVRGLPDCNWMVIVPKEVEVFDYLGARELERLICRSRLVLARSGYSTVMDLIRLRRRAVYIPTPGQPEQEYLGQYLQERGLGICVRQRGFVLTTAMEKLKSLETTTAGDNEVLAAEITGVLDAEIARVLAMARRQSAVADLG